MAAGDRLKEENVRQALYSRMGWNVADPPMPFSRLYAFTLNQESVAVVAVKDGKLTTVYDDCNLFPSDALTAQLRILGA